MRVDAGGRARGGGLRAAQRRRALRLGVGPHGATMRPWPSWPTGRTPPTSAPACVTGRSRTRTTRRTGAGASSARALCHQRARSGMDALFRSMGRQPGALAGRVVEPARPGVPGRELGRPRRVRRERARLHGGRCDERGECDGRELALAGGPARPFSALLGLSAFGGAAARQAQRHDFHPAPPDPAEPGGTRRPRPRPRRPARRQPLRPPRAAPLGHRDLRPGGARQGRQRRLEALRHGQLAVAAGGRRPAGPARAPPRRATTASRPRSARSRAPRTCSSASSP